MRHAFSRLFQKVFAIAAVLALGWGAITPTALAATNLSHADKSAYSYIISPSDGQTVPEEFTVKFGLSGMGVAPAGVDKEGTGHHHLLIDVDELPKLDEPLAATSHIKHFGGGQTEASISLPPGQHTLQLLLGNYTHVPHDNPVLSDKIEITVQ
ncbi:MAG: DUF4399 domain-containing protein [Cyanobacteria bacterium J06621_11]